MSQGGTQMARVSAWAGLAALAWLVLVLLTACSRPAPAAPRLELDRRACLAEPPPTSTPVELAGPAEGCPDRWTACLDRTSTLALVRYLADLRRYAADAYSLCGPEPAKETP